MNLIKETLSRYENSNIDKPSFIKNKYEEHHGVLFDYSTYLEKTNVASNGVTDNAVVMASRDIGVKMISPPADHRVAPIETLNFLDYETIDSAMIMRLVLWSI